MNSTYGVKLLLCIVYFIFFVVPIAAHESLTLIVTNNLRGNFSLELDDTRDPLLTIARGILYERATKHIDCYIDLGNAFSPGILSKYSFGAVMFDYFEFLQCNAVLVSSFDIGVGLKNLELASSNSSVRLLSLNITRNNRPVLNPYWVYQKNGIKVAFVGITSSKGIFDVAEKQVLNVSVSEYREYLSATIASLKSEGCNFIIVISGLSANENMQLLHRYPTIDCIIAGGDATGLYYGVYAPRVDLDDGRSIITLASSAGYYVIQLSLQNRVIVTSLTFSSGSQFSNAVYGELVDRINYWKQQFSETGTYVLASNFTTTNVSPVTIAHLLRHYYKSEIGIVHINDILPTTLSDIVTNVNVQQLVQNDFLIFRLRLTGRHISALRDSSVLVFSGLSEGKIQGYPIDTDRTYRVVLTQSAYEIITERLKHSVKFSNTWTSLSELIARDIQNEQCIARKDFSYLDRRWRLTVDVNLSNIYDNSVVTTKSPPTPPPGMPKQTYTRWGFENSADISLYNQYHKISIMPYMYYMRQDELYLQNLLRGTLLYTFFMSQYLNPYHKSQVDTIVVKKKDDNLRPVLFRETVGASIVYRNYVNGRIGIGFEKQVKDPEKEMLFGAESTLQIRIPFLNYFTYTFNLDNFITVPESNQKYQIRVEIRNAITVAINSYLTLSLHHRWFYFNPLDTQIPYKYTQIRMSLDVKTKFKLF